MTRDSMILARGIGTTDGFRARVRGGGGSSSENRWAAVVNDAAGALELFSDATRGSIEYRV